MAVIEFRTLGTLDLRRTDGSELHSLLAQPKRVALLAYLCVASPPGFHRRDTALGLFWPESDETHARTSLRNALHFLRHSLGEAALLSRGDEEVGVNSDLVWCDATAFDQMARSGNVEDALNLYRGDFLTGFFLDETPGFERWVEGERSRLRACAARAARLAAERSEREQSVTDAIILARRAVELTDRDERAVRRLMELLARAGDRAGALEAYDRFARHLAESFGAEPSADTRAVADRLRSRTAVRVPSETAVKHAAAPVLDEPVSVKTSLTNSIGLAPRYSIEGELGRGGMSTVFLGRDRKHDRAVAIKILRPDIAALLGTDRFLVEIAIASSLHHPHILPLLDSGVTKGLPYYVMPHSDGETLRSRLRRERILSVEQAIQITREIADGLAHAHANGVIHRDIKPENILLENGHALVTDFGIARALSQSSSQRLTQAGIAVGTAAYMSPEQAEAGENLDARTDIYALACVLYEMLTGDPPFPGSSTQAILARKATEPAPRLRSVRETISPRLERSVLKALARVPADRFKTIKDFAHALEGSTEERWRSIARMKAARALAVAAVIVTVVGAVLMGERSLYGRADSHAVLTGRKMITNTGRVSFPTISGDGKSLAYLSTRCRGWGCTYAVQVQDIDGSASRQVLDSVSEFAWGGLEWGPDRRNILASGRIKGKSGTFLVPTLGGEARWLGPTPYAFWADGDSLVTYRLNAQKKFWIFVSGLDGVPRDSFAIKTQDEVVSRLIPVPNTRWIVVGLAQDKGVQWASVDRSGRVISRASPREGHPPAPRASVDALWVGASTSGSSLSSVVRIAFDPTTGKFGSHEDTVYTGSPTSIGISADGGTFVVDEGTTEYTLWELAFADAIKGHFPEKARLMIATSVLANELSHDGSEVLVGRISGSGDNRWEVFPFGGGPATPISGTPASGLWADSNRLTLRTETPAGVELSLLDIASGVRRGSYVLPDSDIEEFTSLPGEGWVWVANGSRSIKVHRRGEAVRAFKFPNWYVHVGTIAASRDGKALVFVGSGPAKSRDSVQMSLMSLTDGAVKPLKTVFGGFPAPAIFADGTMLFSVWDTPDWLTLYHLRRSGEMDWKTSIPRPVWAFSPSRDMRRAGITVRDYHADALMSRVVRR